MRFTMPIGLEWHDIQCLAHVIQSVPRFRDSTYIPLMLPTLFTDSLDQPRSRNEHCKRIFQFRTTSEFYEKYDIFISDYTISELIQIFKHLPPAVQKMIDAFVLRNIQTTIQQAIETKTTSLSLKNRIETYMHLRTGPQPLQYTPLEGYTAFLRRWKESNHIDTLPPLGPPHKRLTFSATPSEKQPDHQNALINELKSIHSKK